MSNRDDFKAAREPISKVYYNCKCGMLSCFSIHDKDSILDEHLANIVYYARSFIDILVASVEEKWVVDVPYDIMKLMNDFEKYHVFNGSYVYIYIVKIPIVGNAMILIVLRQGIKRI